jgi:CRP-like cAMP-binding protein
VQINELLSRVSIFAKLRKEQLDRLSKVAKPKTFPKDTAIFFQDDRAGALYVVVKGAVKVYQTADDGKERVLNTLGAGEIFGELGLLDEQPRSATVATLEPTEVLEITNKELRAVVDATPEVLWKIVEALCERIRQLSTETLDMSFRDVPYRILSMLVQATTRLGQVTPLGTLVSVDAAHLASQVNCGTDQASRVLNKYAEQGLLKLEEGYILVPDTKALTRALEYEQG